MVGWHPSLNGHEFEQTPGHSEGQGILVRIVKAREAWRATVHGVPKSRTRLSD